MKMKKLGKRLLSLMLCLTLLLAYLPAGLLTVGGAEAPLEVISGSKKADPSTINWENFFGPDKMDTEYAGGVWTDKSVFTGESSELPGVTMNDSGNFLIALSAIASNLSITGHTSAPTDTSWCWIFPAPWSMIPTRWVRFGGAITIIRLLKVSICP